MGQEKSNDQPPPPPTLLQRWGTGLRSLPGSGLLFAVIPLLILGYFGWYYYGAEHLDRTFYLLKMDNIELTPRPEWIYCDVRAEVYRSGGLSEVSLLDPAATATIAHAFEAHTWIKSTHRVQKLSGGKVQVEVVYRRPAAMVYYHAPAVPPTPSMPANKGSCLPVDVDGCVLPGGEPMRAQVHNYFMIFAPNAAPPGEVGMAFGDDRITEALLLCKSLEPLRAQFKLECIYVEADTLNQHVGDQSAWIMIVTSADKRNAIWGHAPGKESKDEPLVEEKIASLRSWLNAPAPSSDIAILDLRQRRNLVQRLINTVPPAER